MFPPLWVQFQEVVSASTDRFPSSAGELPERNTMQR